MPLLFSAFFVISQVYFQNLMFLFSEQMIHYVYYFLGTATWLTLAWLFSHIINVFFWDGIVAHSIGRSPPYLLKSFTTLLILLIAVAGIVGVVFGQSITGIWATSGILGGIVGFALKDMIADFFTGIAMDIDKPFAIGDWVMVYDPKGKHIFGCISQITWRSTRITKLNNTTVVFPNNVMSKMPVHNLSANGQQRRFDLPFTFDSRIEPARIKRILLAAAYSVPGVWDNPKPKVIIDNVNRAGVDYQLRFWIDPEAFGPRKAITQVLEVALTYLHRANIRLLNDMYRSIETLSPQVFDLDLNRKEVLGRISLFSCLNEAEKTKLIDVARQHIFQAGEDILREGEEGDSLFILMEGVLDVYVHQDLQNSQQTKVGQIHPDDIFGEKSLLTGEKRSATVKAVTESVVIEIEKKDLAPILKERPIVAEGMSNVMAERLMKTEKSKEKALTRAQEELELAKAKESYLFKIKSFFGL